MVNDEGRYCTYQFLVNYVEDEGAQWSAIAHRCENHCLRTWTVVGIPKDTRCDVFTLIVGGGFSHHV